MQTSLYHSAMCARKTVSDILHLGVFRPICHSEHLMHLLLRQRTPSSFAYGVQIDGVVSGPRVLLRWSGGPSRPPSASLRLALGSLLKQPADHLQPDQEADEDGTVCESQDRIMNELCAIQRLKNSNKIQAMLSVHLRYGRQNLRCCGRCVWSPSSTPFFASPESP